MARKKRKKDLSFIPLPESTSGPGGSISNARFNAFKRNLGAGTDGKPLADTSGLKPGQFEAFATRPGSNRIVGDVISNIPAARSIGAQPLRKQQKFEQEKETARARAHTLFGGTGGRAQTPVGGGKRTFIGGSESDLNPQGKDLSTRQLSDRSQAASGRTGVRWDKIRTQMDKEDAQVEKAQARAQTQEDLDAASARTQEEKRAGRATPEEQAQVIASESKAAIDLVNAEADAAIKESRGTREDELAKIREKAKAEGDAKKALAAAEAEIAARTSKNVTIMGRNEYGEKTTTQTRTDTELEPAPEPAKIPGDADDDNNGVPDNIVWKDPADPAFTGEINAVVNFISDYEKLADGDQKRQFTAQYLIEKERINRWKKSLNATPEAAQ